MKSLVFTTITLFSTLALAWGGRGHNTICETAVFLVKEPGLKEYLQNKPQMMGHLCNMPDFYWKSLGGEANKLGNPTHFIDVEVINLPVDKIPLDYQKIVADYTGKPNAFKKDSTIFSIPTEFGSIWWRADQFFRRITGLEKDFKTAKPPANGKEEQNNDLPYNKLAYDMVINMGLMGHFVGDASQPFHTTADYDGYEAGHGGIHAYYEDSAVGYFDGDMGARILKTARAMKGASFLKPKTTLEKMKALSEVSRAEIPKILKVDPIVKKSTVVKERGMEIKTPAERLSGKIGHQRFEKFIITDMARGALLLANLWDESYIQAGRPQLAAYKSYKYPFTVDFVAPDYFEEKTVETKKEK